MSRRSPRIAIDARPHGPSGALAEARVRGQSVLERLLEQAMEFSAERVLIHAPAEDHQRLRRLVAGFAADRYEFVSDVVPRGVVVLRADRLYGPSALRRALRRGRDPETAVVWRLDSPHALAGAEQELERRQSYQPLGRYWSLTPARAVARALRPTCVRPNAVTLAAAALMLGAAAAVAFAKPGVAVQLVVAVTLAAALVLDTADGHLARLQGTASEFGRWLDAYLDELADMALHAAIAWGAFVRDGHAGWLVLGMVYAMGKYQFVVAMAEPNHTDSDNLLDRPAESAPGHNRDNEANLSPSPLAGEGRGGGSESPTRQPKAPSAPLVQRPPTLTLPHKAREDQKTRRVAVRKDVWFKSRLAGSVRLMGHADVRWHLWIVLAAVGRLDAALATYALYFPARALAVAVRKGVRRG